MERKANAVGLHASLAEEPWGFPGTTCRGFRLGQMQSSICCRVPDETRVLDLEELYEEEERLDLQLAYLLPWLGVTLGSQGMPACQS